MPKTAEALLERVKALRLIRNELDRELSLLTGHEVEVGPRTEYHCVRCKHDWISRLVHKPRMCPKCKAVHFERPPRWRYEDRVKTKQSAIEAPLPHSVLTRAPEPVEEVTLTPPPMLSLRDKLALLYSENPKTEQFIPLPQPVIVEEATEEELVESINNPEAT